MMRNLPIDLVRNFTVIVDAGSMQKASERMPLSASALSLQMKRLEDLLQLSLFRRDIRGLTLTAAGKAFLQHGRKVLEANDRAIAAVGGEARLGAVRLGLVQDFAEIFLRGPLKRQLEADPGLELEVRCANSSELLAQLQGNELDLVCSIGQEGDADALGTEPMLWLGDKVLLTNDALPLAVLTEPCRFRDAALAALQRARRPYRILFQTDDLSALRVAVASGIAVTVRTSLFASNSIPILHWPLATLPKVAFVMRHRQTAHGAVERLASAIRHAIRSAGAQVS